MLNVEARVAQWRAVYRALDAAEQRLCRARASRCGPGRATAELEREVRQLRADNEQALRALDAALAASKAAASTF